MGKSNTMTLVKVAVLLFLVGVSTTTVDARFDPTSIITQMLMNNGDTYFLQKSSAKSSEGSCCHKCACTKSKDPQCMCLDIGENCHSGCDDCICALSQPPQCRCLDITDSCLKACS